MGQMTQPTLSQHWRTMVSQPRHGLISPSRKSGTKSRTLWKSSNWTLATDPLTRDAIALHASPTKSGTLNSMAASVASSLFFKSKCLKKMQKKITVDTRVSWSRRRDVITAAWLLPINCYNVKHFTSSPSRAPAVQPPPINSKAQLRWETHANSHPNR